MPRRDPQNEDEQSIEPDVAPAAETPGVVRHVTYAVGEGVEQRWGWEGLDISGQVVTRCEPTFPSQAAAEKDAGKA